jgi:pimeloyl-ACP methyl ester carboxylesterase
MAWAELSDVRCYYELVGQGDPLLLIPGLGGNCRVWDPVAPLLADDFTMILADNRGMGRSVPRRKARSLADYAADIAELFDRLQLNRAHVLGISLGGLIAQRFAIDHPSLVDKLVLVSCTDRFSPYLKRIVSLLGHSLRRLSRSAFVQTMELLGTAPLYLDANVEEIDRLAQERVKAGVPARAMGDQLRCLLRSEIPEEHYKIGAPTLVIAGEHDALIPNCYARQMAGKIPGSSFEIIPGAGHNPMAEVPQTVVPLITRFLRERPASAAAAEQNSQRSGGNRGGGQRSGLQPPLSARWQEFHRDQAAANAHEGRPS